MSAPTNANLLMTESGTVELCCDCCEPVPCACCGTLQAEHHTPTIVPRRTKRPVFAGAWAPVTFTRFRCHSADEANAVRKRVQLNAAGELEPLAPEGFSNGYAETVPTTLDVFIRELQGEPPRPEHAFYTAGVSAECAPGESLLMGNLGDGKWRSRSKKGFPFPERDALLAIDTDNIETFPELQTPEDVVDVLAQLGLDADCGASPSGSSYLEWPGGKRGLRGLHTFYSIDQGAEVPRVLDTLHKRAWLAGYGLIVVGSDGKLHGRSIVDRALASGNQPIFEFGAVLLDKRIQQPRKVSPFRGQHRQVVAADILPLTEEQESQYKAIVALAKAEKQGEAEKATDAWIERRTAALPEAERDAARAALLQQRDAKHKDLPPGFPLQLNDGGVVLVSAILADPDAWHRVTLPDPLEPEYGNAKATIFTQEQRDGRPKIISRAHGVETVYFLDPRPGSFDTELFDDDDTSGDAGSEFDGPELALLDEIALVKMGSKSAVLMLDENSDDLIDTMSVQGARDYFAPRQVLLPGEGDRPPRQVPEFNLWLKHPQRRTLRGLEFAPDGKVRPGYFNLWRGFAVTPAEGSCVRILQHVREVICSGNDEHYLWLVRWMAHVVQHPTEKPGTAIVLRGREGTGKNVFAEAFGELFGRAFFKASRMDHLVGKFNKHLAGRLVVFSNEAVWGGNKSDEGALKDLITEREQTVEPKGLDAFQVKDYSRHILATNESWAVPAGMDARRWFVLDVSDSRIRDYPYFEAIKRELQEGGRPALLHYLMNLDLTAFNVRDAPLTAGLLDQKQRSLSSVGQWWLHTLQEGFPSFPVFDDDEGLTDVDGGVVSRVELFQDYRRFATETGHGKYLSPPNLVGTELRKMLPALEDYRPRVGGRRVWCYRVPPLRACRSAFDNFMRQPLPWPADDETV